MTTRQKLLGAIGIGSAVIIGCIGVSWALLKQIRVNKTENATIISLANTFGIDAAKVNGTPVPYSSYITHMQAARVFMRSPLAMAQGSTGEFGDTEKKLAYERAIRVTAVESMAAEKKISPSSADINGAFDQLIAQASTTTDPTEVDAFLKEQFNWSREEFKQNIIRPALLEESLRAAYAEQGGAAAFETALQGILENKTKRYLQF